MWTWLINSITPNSDKLSFTLVYTVTNGVTSQQITEPFVSATPPDDIKQTCIRKCDDAVNYRNKVDAQKAAQQSVVVTDLIGSQTDVKAAIQAEIDAQKPPDDPAIIAKQAWAVLLSSYQASLNFEKLGFTPAQSSADILAEMGKSVQPGYESLVGGLRL